jgi:hypothetical protein
MVRSPLACLMGALLLAVVDAPAQDLPAYDAPRALAAPTIDGAGGDPAWEAAPVTHLVDVEDLTGETVFPRSTEVRMLWDDEALYLLFELVDPDVWSTFTNRDDQIWQQEVVEIFIDPDGDGVDYAEIEVNPLGTLFDLILSRPWADGGQGFAGWDPDVTHAVGIAGTVNDDTDEDEGWVVEIALPWTALAEGPRDVLNGVAAPPQVGDEWRVNLYRFERPRADGEVTEAQANAWSPVGVNDFHRPDRFGRLRFVESGTAVEPSSWSGVKDSVDRR